MIYKRKKCEDGSRCYYVFGLPIWRRKEKVRKILNNVKYSIEKIQNVHENLFNRLNDVLVDIKEDEQKIKNKLFDLSLNNSLINDIIKLLIIQNQHQKTFLPFKNCNTDKDIVIVGCGPSLSDYIPLKNAVHIGVNRSFKVDNLVLDYLFLQDYQAVQTYLHEALEYGSVSCKKFIGMYFYEGRTSIPMYHAQGDNRYLYYLLENEIPFYADISSSPMPQFASVIFAAASFALYTNPKRLYLVGCDASDLGYFDGDKQKEGWMIPLVKKGWNLFKEFAETRYADTEVISINPVGLKGMFKDVYMNQEK